MFYLLKIKYFIGAFLIIIAWLFPFVRGPSRDLIQHFFYISAICSAAILFGFNEKVNKKILIVIFFAILFILIVPIGYVNNKLFLIAGILFFWISCEIGAALRVNQAALTAVIVAIFFSSILNALEGLLQYFGLADALWPWIPSVEIRGQAIGALRQRNLLATFLCCGVVSIVWLVQLKKFSMPFAWFSILILGFGIAATNSRIGAVEIIFLFILAFLLNSPDRKTVLKLFLGAVVIVGVAAILLPLVARWHGFGAMFLSDRFAELKDVALNPRTLIWNNVIKLILIHPWVGWGWGELPYAHYLTLLAPRFNSEQEGLLSNAHNLILHLAVTLGIPATVFVIWLVSWVGCKTITSNNFFFKKTVKNNQNRSCFAIMILMVIGLHSMVEFPLWNPGFIFLVGLVTGFLAPSKLPLIDSSVAGRVVNYLTYGIAILLVVSCALAWRDYTKMINITQISFGEKSSIKLSNINTAKSWLYEEYLDFAKLIAIKVDASNALLVKQKAEKLLHFSPEPIVIEKLLSSLIYLDHQDEVLFHAERYCYSHPIAYCRWLHENSVRLVSSVLFNLNKKCNRLNV